MRIALGDTKIFDTSVLPAVLIVEGLNGSFPTIPSFTSIYESKAGHSQEATGVIDALTKTGIVEVPDGRHFEVLQGKLDTSNQANGVWRVATEENDAWLATVLGYTWGTFRDLGKVRVGVKTCADKIFIRHDWRDMPETEQPELLRPLTTHHIGRRYRAKQPIATAKLFTHTNLSMAQNGFSPWKLRRERKRTSNSIGLHLKDGPM